MILDLHLGVKFDSVLVYQRDPVTARVGRGLDLAQQWVHGTSVSITARLRRSETKRTQLPQ